jgi:hypothetical protein
VFKLAKQERKLLRPWMRPTGMHELKTTLISAILVYLVVDFATDWATLGQDIHWVLLVKPASILMLAAALRLFVNDTGSEDDAGDVTAVADAAPPTATPSTTA